MGSTGLIVLRPRSHQSPVRPSQTASCSVRPFPAHTPHSASSLVRSARACFPRCANRPVSSFVLWRATCNVLDLPGTPLPTQHSFPLTRQVDMRVHCVVHLAQDRFPHRSSCRLRVGKAAKGVAPAPCSETKCYAPAERCGVAQYFGQRETRSNRSPKKRLHHQQTEQTKCPWLHCQDVGPLQHI